MKSPRWHVSHFDLVPPTAVCCIGVLGPQAVNEVWQVAQAVGNMFATCMEAGLVTALERSPVWQVSHLDAVPPMAVWSMVVPGPQVVNDLWQVAQAVGNMLATCMDAGVVVALER